MEFNSSKGSRASTTAIPVVPAQRWELYHRLRSLGLACEYRSGGPLTVGFESPVEVAQYWCVLKQMTGSRSELVEWLQGCWQRSS